MIMLKIVMDIKITVYLTEITSTDDVREYTIEKENTILGRDEAADIVIEIKKISRQHAVITCIPLGHTIKDLGSHNGTFVNGNKLGKEPELLKDQDKIVLGGVIAFRFHDQNATSSGPNIGNLFGIWIDEKNRSVWVDAIMVDPPLTAAHYPGVRPFRTPHGRAPPAECQACQCWITPCWNRAACAARNAWR